MRLRRHIVAAIVTAVTLSSVTSALLPNPEPHPATEPAISSQYADTHQRDLTALRRRGTILQDAINTDELTPAELRASADAGADDATESALRDLLRRP